MPPDGDRISRQLACFPPGTTAHSATLDNQITMHWFQVGTGPVAILLHGFPSLPTSFAKQAAALCDEYTVVIPHLRGYAPTSAPKAVSEYTLPHLVSDVTGLANVNGWDKFHLAGHDWGGAIAWAVAMHAPHRLHSLSVLNSCPPRILLHRFFRSGQARRSWYMFLFQIPYLGEWLFKKRGIDAFRKLYVAAASNQAVFENYDFTPHYETVTQKDFGGFKYYRAASRSFPPPQLQQTSTPSQVIWGLGDPVLGAHLIEPSLYETWTDAMRIVSIRDAGHWVQLEAEQQVNDALRQFWKDNNHG